MTQSILSAVFLPLALSQLPPINTTADSPTTEIQGDVTSAGISFVQEEVVQEVPPPPTFDEEVRMLALALYFEARVDEPDEGLQAIASVIVNRTHSSFFPSTVTEVVSHGANPGKTNGGCQFSFMCDQFPEDISVLCELRPEEMAEHWGDDPCAARWEAYLAYAYEYMENGTDNTDGALMYYAAWMGRPYWHRDLLRSSIVRRGSHVFGQSRHFLEARYPREEVGTAGLSE